MTKNNLPEGKVEILYPGNEHPIVFILEDITDSRVENEVVNVSTMGDPHVKVTPTGVVEITIRGKLVGSIK